MLMSRYVFKYSVTKIVLFGSRARGMNTERSDIDIESPREILQCAYKIGFINDPEVWLLMLKKRNTSVHICNEEEVDEMIMLIRDSFIPAFTVLKDTLVKKLEEAESNWM